MELLETLHTKENRVTPISVVREICVWGQIFVEEDRQYTYNVAWRRVRVTFVVVDKQYET
jgi:hypothetical protein